METLDQETLNGLVPVAQVGDVVGYGSSKEKEVAVHGAAPRTLKVVDPEWFNENRTTKPKKNEPRYLTIEEVRKHLPPTYSVRNIDGDVYPALHSPRTVEVRGYLPEQVEDMKGRLADYRARIKATWEANAKRRRELQERYLAGDPSIREVYEVVEPTSRRSSVVPAVLGESNFGRTYSPREVEVGGMMPDGEDRQDPMTGQWLPV